MKIILTESQERKLLQIDELRSGFMNHVVQKSKEIYGQEWPEYVLLDWVYKNTKKLDPGYVRKDEDIRNIVSILMKNFLKIYGRGHWVLENINININSFERSTREILRSRKSAVMAGIGREDLPKDYERHQTQKELIKKTGQPPKEPIILIQTPSGYDMLEGYHRTIQSLIEFGEYMQPAWVYIQH